jgi:fatty-acyl-CoA synthase
MAGGGLATLGATQTGGCHVLSPAFDPERVLHLIEAERTPMMICAPMMPGKILHRPEINRPSIRPSPTLSLGGALVPSYLVRIAQTLGLKATMGFGQNESSPYITHTRINDIHPGWIYTAGPPVLKTGVDAADG